MQFFLEGTLSVCKKVILVSVIVFFSISTRTVAMEMIDPGDCILPSHEEIEAEISYLIDRESGATAWQKIKKYASRSNGYIEITSENAPKIYQVLESAAKAVGIEVPSKIYIYLLHNLSPSPSNPEDYYGAGVATKYLSIGSGILLELTPWETKAILEHEFMHIKDRMIFQCEAKICEILSNKWLRLYLCSLGVACVVIVGLILNSLYFNKFAPDEFINAVGCIGVLVFLSKFSLDHIALHIDVCNLRKDLEKHADLNVSSKADLASALKKIVVCSVMEMHKHLPAEERDRIKRYLIEKIEDGRLDFPSLVHPSLQERLAYLK